MLPSPVVRPATPILDISRSDSLGQWSLVATASRKAWQVGEIAGNRFEGQGMFRGPATTQASEGEARRANLSFDWQRWLADGALRAGAFATARELAVNAGGFPSGEGSALWERVAQEDRGTRIGAHGAWSGHLRMGGVAFASAARVRVQGESLESQGRLDRASGEAPRLFLDDRLRQTFAGLELEAEARPLPGVRASLATAIERYRFDVASARGAQAGVGAGTLVSPRLGIVAATRGGAEYFASLGRGTPGTRERGPTVAFDPRDGTPIAHLDPISSATFAEAGLRNAWAHGIEARISAWQARTAVELTLLESAGVQAVDRPAARSGVTFSARYLPAPWLSLDLDASALDARYREGARERIPGAAERHVNAGATVRNGSKWSASLFVKYLGARTPVEEDAMRLRSSTTVGAQFASRLSKTTRLTVDVFNVFNQRTGDVDYFAASRLWAPPGTVDGFLFHPAAPRGFRALLTTRF